LNGNLDLPRHSGLSTAAWEGETDNTDPTTPQFDSIQLRPNRLAAYTEFSKQLLYQSSLSVEQVVSSELENAVARAVETAAINGSGSSNQPTGILNAANVNVVALGTDGGAPTHAKLIDMMTAIAEDNADVDRMGWLMTPGLKGFLQQTKVDAGSGIFVWPTGSMELMGYRAEVSTLVPSTLTKGNGSALHAAIFGNFQDLIIANWGGMDIVVDPYSQAIAGKVRVTINTFWDIDRYHDQSFAVIKDADIS
jgi:HK97 family phage major capsid protein